MREKVVPIPFLGKEVSAWLYRTTRWVREHPYRATGVVFLAAAGSIFYEVNVTHKNRIPSPNVNNHLEYELRHDSGFMSQAKDDKMMSGVSHQVGVPVVNSKDSLNVDEEEQKRTVAMVMGRVEELEKLLSTTEDSEKRAELQRIIDEEKENLKKVGNTTMRVTSGQLYVREPHWGIRNNERNWTILARDQQQQKDHYWYRLERSREDDFARNTYSRS
ncbi:uncharacterized protein TM35_000082860 [Trypanosoma theileri]|uniref:Uncharacterized protein n=1 Tax=Trypanosoma theileri TaxID=67003 RepID=A0A1X0P0X4_9TRYP|nr:uncharacterized protein TM35_000082860 [Trypanosoma theileri]ORC90488.1 hypothetical protein TM35_000082860 [Trypanosoma theileri]